MPKANKNKVAGPGTTGSARTSQENQERAFVAASRRSDRSVEARMESANRASEVHFARTGRCLKITEKAVQNEEMYEEEDLPKRVQYRNLHAHYQRQNQVNQRFSDAFVAQNATRGALNHHYQPHWVQGTRQPSHASQMQQNGVVPQQRQYDVFHNRINGMQQQQQQQQQQRFENNHSGFQMPPRNAFPQLMHDGIRPLNAQQQQFLEGIQSSSQQTFQPSGPHSVNRSFQPQTTVSPYQMGNQSFQPQTTAIAYQLGDRSFQPQTTLSPHQLGSQNQNPQNIVHQRNVQRLSVSQQTPIPQDPRIQGAQPQQSMGSRPKYASPFTPHIDPAMRDVGLALQQHQSFMAGSRNGMQSNHGSYPYQHNASSQSWPFCDAPNDTGHRSTPQETPPAKQCKRSVSEDTSATERSTADVMSIPPTGSEAPVNFSQGSKSPVVGMHAAQRPNQGSIAESNNTYAYNAAGSGMASIPPHQVHQAVLNYAQAYGSAGTGMAGNLPSQSNYQSNHQSNHQSNQAASSTSPAPNTPASRVSAGPPRQVHQVPDTPASPVLPSVETPASSQEDAPAGQEANPPQDMGNNNNYTPLSQTDLDLLFGTSLYNDSWPQPPNQVPQGDVEFEEFINWEFLNDSE